AGFAPAVAGADDEPALPVVEPGVVADDTAVVDVPVASATGHGQDEPSTPAETDGLPAEHLETGASDATEAGAQADQYGQVEHAGETGRANVEQAEEAGQTGLVDQFEQVDH